VSGRDAYFCDGPDAVHLPAFRYLPAYRNRTHPPRTERLPAGSVRPMLMATDPLASAATPTLLGPVPPWQRSASSIFRPTVSSVTSPTSCRPAPQWNRILVVSNTTHTCSGEILGRRPA